MTTIEAAVEELERGGIVVVPTDTVYGLAALPSHPDGVRALFELKGRPSDKPIPVLVADVEAAGTVARLDAGAQRLATAFWPGPLTIVLPRATNFDADLGGREGGTVAVRVPASATTRSLLRLSGPLAVTSANRSAEPPANSVDEARRIFGPEVGVYVDGGPGGGSPSTVVSLVGEARVLREGALDEAEVLAVLDR